MTTGIDDFSDNSSTTGRLTVGGSAKGTTETSGDSDWFRVTLEAGKNYLFSASAGTLINLVAPAGDSTLLYSDFSPDFSFRAPVSGDYYLKANRYATGDYTVNARQIPLDDYDRNSGTAGELKAGVTRSGTVESASDFDHFNLGVIAGQLYRVSLSKADITQVNSSLTASTDYTVSLKQAGSITAGKHTIDLAPSSTGNVSVAVVGAAPGTYTLAVEQIADDYAGNTTTTGRLTLGGAVTGKPDLAYDEDWFAIDLDPGTAYTFNIAATSTTNVSSIYTVRDASGAMVFDSRGQQGNPGIIAYSPEKAGLYYVAVEAGEYSLGPYVLSALATKDDVSNQASSYPTLPNAGQFEGKLDYIGDKDTVRIAAIAGNYYTVSVTSTTPNGTVYAQVRNPDGAEIGSYGTNGDIRFKADVSGSYLVTMRTPNSRQETYTLKSTAVLADDAGNKIAAAKPIALDQIVNGVSEIFYDTDVYKVRLEAGKTYVLSYDGPATPALLSADGQNLGTGGTTPSVSGDYYVQITGAYDKTGSYSFKLSAVQDAISGDKFTTAKITADGTFASILGAGSEADWIAFDADAGTAYTFDVAITKNNYFLQPLSIVDANGISQGANIVASAGKFTATFATPSAGTYYISLTGNRSPTDLAYTITASSTPKDDHGNHANVATVPLPGKAVTGKFGHTGDIDALKMHLQADHFYQIKTWATHSSGAVIDYLTGTLELPGSPYSSIYWIGAAPFKVKEAGNYVQLLTAKSYYGADNFSFELVDLGKDDYGDDAASASAMSGPTAVGYLVATFDHDKLTVHLKKDALYTIELHNLADAGAGTGQAQALTMSLGLPEAIPRTSLEAKSGEVASKTFAAFMEADYTLSLVRYNQTETTPYFIRVLEQTGDKQAPVVTKFHPASASLPVFNDIVIDFSEPMLRDAGTIRLLDGTGSAFATYKGWSDARIAINGASLSLANDAPLYPGASYTLAFDSGSLSDLSGNDLAARTFTFTAAAATAAGDGNDLLTASANGAGINGGKGLDTVYYQGTAAGHQVRIEAGVASVAAAGATAKDTLANVERLLFTSGEAVALDVDGVAGGVYRLYQAAFDRTPDASGAGYWLSRMDKGTTLRQAATEFIASPEFQATYGANLDNASFVDQLYQNVLHRDGDASGVKFWNGVLAGGEPRANVLVGFSESIENQTATAELIANGFTYIPYWL